MFTLIFVLSLALAVASNLFDVIMTERGLKAGVALEAFDWLVGKSPSFLKLLLRDLMILGIAFGLVLLISLVNEPLAIGGAIFMSAAFVARHVRGALNWQRLLDGKPLRVYDHPMTIWEKFWS